MRFRNVEWNLRHADGDVNSALNTSEAIVAVLMDIRERLDVLRCPATQEIPHTLRRIAKNTERKKRAKR